MANIAQLSAEPRTAGRKKAAKATRNAGRVPAVIYGHGREPETLSVGAADLTRLLEKIHPESTIVELGLAGGTVKTLIREIQRHPLQDHVMHVDFYEIRADEKVTLKVPVHLVGNPDGVRNAGGVLDQVLREVEIEVLPEHIPARVELDVTSLMIGQVRHVSDLSIPNAVILTGAELTIATVVPPRAEEVAAPTAEATPETAEPELIRKVREEEGEEGEGTPPAEGKGEAKPKS